MSNAVQLCLAANNILLMRKWNHDFLLLAIALAWKWQIALLPKIFIYKQTRWSNEKTIITRRIIQDFTLDPSRPRSPSAPGGPTGPWHINIQETSRQEASVTREGYLRGERAETCLKLVILRLKDLPLKVMVSPNFFFGHSWAEIITKYFHSSILMQYLKRQIDRLGFLQSLCRINCIAQLYKSKNMTH